MKSLLKALRLFPSPSAGQWTSLHSLESLAYRNARWPLGCHSHCTFSTSCRFHLLNCYIQQHSSHHQWEHHLHSLVSCWSLHAPSPYCHLDHILSPGQGCLHSPRHPLVCQTRRSRIPSESSCRTRNISSHSLGQAVWSDLAPGSPFEKESCSYFLFPWEILFQIFPRCCYGRRLPPPRLVWFDEQFGVLRHCPQHRDIMRWCLNTLPPCCRGFCLPCGYSGG